MKMIVHQLFKQNVMYLILLQILFYTWTNLIQIFFCLYQYLTLGNNSFYLMVSFLSIQLLNKLITFFLSSFFNTKICFIFLLQFLFIKCSKNLFIVKVFYYVCPPYMVSTFLITKTSFDQLVA